MVFHRDRRATTPCGKSRPPRSGRPKGDPGRYRLWFVILSLADGDPKRRRPIALGNFMDRDIRLKRLRFRAWHRGTKEADLMVGGFFDAYATRWSDADIDWFEAFIEEQDVDIMAWAMGVQAVPARWDGAMMRDLKTLTYVPIAK